MMAADKHDQSPTPLTPEEMTEKAIARLKTIACILEAKHPSQDTTFEGFTHKFDNVSYLLIRRSMGNTIRVNNLGTNSQGGDTRELSISYHTEGDRQSLTIDQIQTLEEGLRYMIGNDSYKLIDQEGMKLLDEAMEELEMQPTDNSLVDRPEGNA